MKVISELVLTCWICGKHHSASMYDEWLKDKKVYSCECGGQVISNSGKVMMKAVVCNDKDSLIEKKQRLEEYIGKLKEYIEVKENDIEVKYKLLQATKEELFITDKALESIK